MIHYSIFGVWWA